MKGATHNLVYAKNIGPVLAKRLNEIGIFSTAALAVKTPARAYRELVQKSPGITLPVSYLYALQGALMNVHWTKLPKRLKKELLYKVNLKKQ